MAGVSVVSQAIIALRARTITMAGTVEDGSGNPLARRVLCYRSGDDSAVHASTVSSAVTGAWTMTVNGTTSDWFRVIIVGDRAAGENSKIFDWVQEA